MDNKSNLEKLKSIASDKPSAWLEKARWRQANKNWLDHSFNVALLISQAMRSRGISQKQLAEQMNVKPQYVSKVLKGGENLSLETIVKFEEVLNIRLIQFPGKEAYYVMQVPSGTVEFKFAIKGRKAEESYLDRLKNRNDVSQLYVKANQDESEVSVSDLNLCVQ